MSEAKKKPAQDKKPNFFTKVLAFLKNLPRNIAKPFMNTWRELKKVTWPTRKDLVSYTLIVLAFMTFMGLVIGLLDMGSSALIALLASRA